MQEKIDALRNLTVPARSLFIGGDWRAAADGGVLDVTSPIDGRKLTTIADAGAVDVDRAVKAARAAFEKGRWAKAAPATSAPPSAAASA